MVVSLCNSFLFITIHLPVVVSCSWSPRSPLFLSGSYFIISRAVSLTPCSAVLCSGTKHNDSSRNTHFYQNAMPPGSWAAWKGTRIQGTKKERRTENTADVRMEAKYGGRTAMKRASIWREVLSFSSQWDPSSSNRRECLYIAVIMGCNGFVNGGNKERKASLVPRCHLPFFSCLFCSSLFLSEMKMRGSETSNQPTTVLDNRRSQLPRVTLPYLHRSSVNREDHLLMLYGHPHQQNH